MRGGVNGYAYVGGNPVNFNDPSGLVAREVSNAWTQGVTYFDAGIGQASSALSSGYQGLSKTAQQGYNSLLDSLPGAQAPDNDGHLTLGEANYQYRYGGGQPVTVDINKIDFSGVSAAQAIAEASPKGISYVTPSSINDFLVHGTVGIRVGANDTITAPTAPYDFDYQSLKPDFSLNGSKKNARIIVRNVETFIGQVYAGFGTPYPIKYSDQGKVGP